MAKSYIIFAKVSTITTKAVPKYHWDLLDPAMALPELAKAFGRRSLLGSRQGVPRLCQSLSGLFQSLPRPCSPMPARVSPRIARACHSLPEPATAGQSSPQLATACYSLPRPATSCRNLPQPPTADQGLAQLAIACRNLPHGIRATAWEPWQSLLQTCHAKLCQSVAGCGGLPSMRIPLACS